MIGIIIWAWRLWSSHAGQNERMYGSSMDALVIVRSKRRRELWSGRIRAHQNTMLQSEQNRNILLVGKRNCCIWQHRQFSTEHQGRYGQVFTLKSEIVLWQTQSHSHQKCERTNNERQYGLGTDALGKNERMYGSSMDALGIVRSKRRRELWSGRIRAHQNTMLQSEQNRNILLVGKKSCYIWQHRQFSTEHQGRYGQVFTLES